MSSDQYERLNDRTTVSDLPPGEIEIPVKMLVSGCRTERPRGASLRLDIGNNILTVENRWEASAASGIPLFKMLDSN